MIVAFPDVQALDVVGPLEVFAMANAHGADPAYARRSCRPGWGPPAAYVQQVRVEAARRLLETTRRTVDDIARACGFGTVETMHRTFQRTARTSPGQYRRLFTVPA